MEKNAKFVGLVALGVIVATVIGKQLSRTRLGRDLLA